MIAALVSVMSGVIVSIVGLLPEGPDIGTSVGDLFYGAVSFVRSLDELIDVQLELGALLIFLGWRFHKAGWKALIGAYRLVRG